MATYSKTANQTLIALQTVTASTVVVGSPVDVSTKLGGMVHVRFARKSATASTAAGNIRIEMSFKTSGDNSWSPIAPIQTNIAAVEAEALTGTVNAGQNVLTLASTTNLTAGDVIGIINTTIGNSEWARVKSIVAFTSVTIEDNLVNAQTGSTIYDGAEIYAPIELPAGAIRVRAVADMSLFTQDSIVEVILTTIDGIA